MGWVTEQGPAACSRRAQNRTEPWIGLLPTPSAPSGDLCPQALPFSPQDFLRCVTAALIYFAISITAVAKYSDGASKAAGVFGFFATIVFAIDFYLIFNDVARFLKQGDSADENTAHKAEGEEENSDSDSD